MSKCVTIQYFEIHRKQYRGIAALTLYRNNQQPVSIIWILNEVSPAQRPNQNLLCGIKGISSGKTEQMSFGNVNKQNYFYGANEKTFNF